MKFLFALAIIGGVILAFRHFLAKSAPMSVAEAAKLLDVGPEASTDDILAAHKRLIAKVHPDAGGTDELASRVNQARDILLRQIR